jgi:hypothetical protein
VFLQSRTAPHGHAVSRASRNGCACRTVTCDLHWHGLLDTEAHYLGDCDVVPGLTVGLPCLLRVWLGRPRVRIRGFPTRRRAGLDAWAIPFDYTCTANLR